MCWVGNHHDRKQQELLQRTVTKVKYKLIAASSTYHQEFIMFLPQVVSEMGMLMVKNTLRDSLKSIAPESDGCEITASLQQADYVLTPEEERQFLNPSRDLFDLVK